MELENPFKDMLARVQEKAEARQSVTHEPATEPEPVQTPAAKSVHLPIWPEAVRAVPNGFLRSALFGAVAKGRRRFLDAEQLSSVDGVSIKYTGQRLDQNDLDVWESVLHIVREQELGTQCRFTAYALLKLMGKTDTGKNRELLHKQIVRLRSGTVEATQGRYTYIGGLIHDAFKDEETHEWVVEINPKLKVLYGSDQFTLLDWEIRHKLNGMQLAQWLHGFYASHANPYPYKIETLYKLCGSETSELRSFTQTLKKSLDTLCSKTGWGWEIDNASLVYIYKKPLNRIKLNAKKT
ncbi:MAG: plasmid replication initiator TrfA [Thiomicrospira sp.]|jgi:hypothetical protein|nr:plasmid replication initiator TrfA [Thiomicrospira sp.]